MTKPRTFKRARALAVVVLASALALGATPAIAAPATSNGTQSVEAGECPIGGAVLKWGIKDSFQAYITSAIAKGEWIVAGDVVYESPVFIWSDGIGTAVAATGDARIGFDGSVTFAGHGGVLNLTLANPALVFSNDGAQLRADVRSNDTEGAPSVDEKDIVFGTIAAPTPDWGDGAGARSGVADVTLTEAGATAFGGFYEAGDALDPIDYSFTLGECVVAADQDAIDEEDPATVEEGTVDAPQASLEASAAPVQTDHSGDSTPWIIAAAVGLLAVGAGAVGLVLRARRTQRHDGSGDGDAA